MFSWWKKQPIIALVAHLGILAISIYSVVSIHNDNSFLNTVCWTIWTFFASFILMKVNIN